MKIINVTPGLLPIPPNGWGAVEKIIWEYHQEFKRKGINSEIKYLNDIQYDESCIIHVHVANLANMLHEKGIPYVFTIHDHHAFLHGKDSQVFAENLKAIENSVISLSPCKYLIPYFNSKKLRYFGHAVNTSVFTPNNNKKDNPIKLLCVANNGYAHDPSIDRKGFKFAIEAAMKFNLPITIAGPSNNKKFFSTLSPELAGYNKLSVLYDLTEEQLIDVYRGHDIFLHPSELEAGHPNLTILEAMACGLPVVGTFEETSYDGMIVTERNTEEIVSAIIRASACLDTLRTSALKNADKNSYKNKTLELLKIYSEYKDNIFANQFIDAYNNCKIMSRSSVNLITCSFENGPKVSISGPIDKKYKVKFINGSNGSLSYESIIQNGMWAACAIKYYVKWIIEVYSITENVEELVLKHELSLKSKPVKVIFDSNSLGDILAWVGAVDEFQRRHECEMECVVFNSAIREIFQKNYDNIKFLDKDFYDSPHYAKYKIGCFQDDDNRTNSPVDYRSTGLCQIASMILGMGDDEFKPKIKVTPYKHDKKYVCIATQSTCQAKYWNNDSGWKKVISFLKTKGYEVWCIDKDYSFGVKEKMNFSPSGVKDKTGNISLQERFEQIAGAEFFIGLSSGLSWISWAVDKPTVLISGFTKPYNEFYTPYRVFNESVCNGCWNDTSVKFDPGNWFWCPRGKNFECSSKIHSDEVIKIISKIP